MLQQIEYVKLAVTDALSDQSGPGTDRRRADKPPRTRKPRPSADASFSRGVKNGALDNRTREARYLTAARQCLIDHVGGRASTTQLVLIDRCAWLMLHCLLLDRRMVSAKQDWGENDRKCYLAFSNSLVRTLRVSAPRQPTLAEVLKAECAA